MKYFIFLILGILGLLMIVQGMYLVSNADYWGLIECGMGAIISGIFIAESD